MMTAKELAADLADNFSDNIDGEPAVEDAHIVQPFETISVNSADLKGVEAVLVRFTDGTLFHIHVKQLDA